MKYDSDGERFTESVAGEESIEKIYPNSAAFFTTSQSITITKDCETSSSCPKCKATAAAVKRERMIGMHLKVIDSDGDVLAEHNTSNGVKVLAEKEES